MKTIREAASERILIAAHRGTAGGNIPCNTVKSYEIALRAHADIIEIDIAKAADGSLFVFHPGMEFPHLRCEKSIAGMTREEVEALCFVNQDGTPTSDRVAKLDDILEMIKGRAYVNIDKFWTAMPEITAAVRRHGMEKEVIVKTSADPKWFDMLEEIAPDLPYMPIVRHTDTACPELLKRKISLLGAEVLFTEDTEPVASPEYLKWMHDNGLLVWGNSIVYNHKDIIAGCHTDDEAMAGDPDKAWGWLADRGFDIIQTDWALQAHLYYKEKGRR